MLPSERMAYNKNDVPLINLQPFHPRTNYARIPDDNAQDYKSLPSAFSSYTGYGEVAPGAKHMYSKFTYEASKLHGCPGLPSEQDNHGWRKTVITGAITATVVLLINLVFLIVSLARSPPTGGLGVLYTGDCKLVRYWDTILHVLINILGTILLAASSFAMQCLSSPTRSEVDQAHAQKISLDIGLVSLRNLRHLDWRKGVLWWTLALSTLPLHLLWNSAVISTTGAHEYSTIVVTEGFLSGDPFLDPLPLGCDSHGVYSNTSSFTSIYSSYREGNYSQRLSPVDCINAYATSFITDRRNLLAITTPVNGSTRMTPNCAFNISSEDYEYERAPLWNGSSVIAFKNQEDNSNYWWLCHGYDAFWKESNGDTYCDRAMAQRLLANNGTWYISLSLNDIDSPYPVEYCLSEDQVPQKCTLQYGSSILGLVVACNIVKIIAMIATARLLWNLDEPIFATVGDALASYLERPDNTTVGWCLMGGKQVKSWREGKLEQHQQVFHDSFRSKRLFSATSKTRWYTTIGLCVLYLGVGIGLYFACMGEAGHTFTKSQIWALGIGSVTAGTTLGDLGLIPDILFANSFQLALSATYLLYNSLYTAQCGAIEWASYTIKRRPLRVTYPRGQQRSTYWLQLPYAYGIPLTLLLVLMHFLISQAIFLSRVEWYNAAGQADAGNYNLETSGEILGIGYSPVGILISCCVGGLLISLQLFHSLRPLKTPIPLHLNQSVAISAACQPRTDMDSGRGIKSKSTTNLALVPVMWGATIQPTDENEVGHCSFTADQVGMPENERRYQGRPGSSFDKANRQACLSVNSSYIPLIHR